MSIRSIDLQVLIPRATDAAKVQQITDHQNTLQQQQSAEQMRQLSLRRQQQVQSTPHNTGGRIEGNDRDGQHAGEQEDSQRRQGRQDDDEPADSPDPVRGHNIDIKT